VKSGLQGGRFASESVAGIDRNQWPLSIGMGGRLRPEYAGNVAFLSLEPLNNRRCLHFKLHSEISGGDRTRPVFSQIVPPVGYLVFPVQFIQQFPVPIDL
jgi:hypothetical protein